MMQLNAERNLESAENSDITSQVRNYGDYLPGEEFPVIQLQTQPDLRRSETENGFSYGNEISDDLYGDQAAVSNFALSTSPPEENSLEQVSRLVPRSRSHEPAHGREDEVFTNSLVAHQTPTSQLSEGVEDTPDMLSLAPPQLTPNSSADGPYESFEPEFAEHICVSPTNDHMAAVIGLNRMPPHFVQELHVWEKSEHRPPRRFPLCEGPMRVAPAFDASGRYLVYYDGITHIYAVDLKSSDPRPSKLTWLMSLEHMRPDMGLFDWNVAHHGLKCVSVSRNMTRIGLGVSTRKVSRNIFLQMTKRATAISRPAIDKFVFGGVDALVTRYSVHYIESSEEMAFAVTHTPEKAVLVRCINIQTGGTLWRLEEAWDRPQKSIGDLMAYGTCVCGGGDFW
jgi:hypothetical protein